MYLNPHLKVFLSPKKLILEFVVPTYPGSTREFPDGIWRLLHCRRLWCLHKTTVCQWKELLWGSVSLTVSGVDLDINNPGRVRERSASGYVWEEGVEIVHHGCVLCHAAGWLARTSKPTWGPLYLSSTCSFAYRDAKPELQERKWLIWECWIENAGQTKTAALGF